MSTLSRSKTLATLFVDLTHVDAIICNNCEFRRPICLLYEVGNKEEQAFRRKTSHRTRGTTDAVNIT